MIDRIGPLRFARVRITHAAVAIVIFALILTIRRQADQIQLLSVANQYLREAAATPDQLRLRIEMKERADREVAAWRESEDLKGYNDRRRDAERDEILREMERTRVLP